MKKKVFGMIFAAAVATPLVTLTSCSNDDKVEVVAPTPFIKVYNTQLIFNETMTEATIQGIVANVEFEVKSFPSWIESVTLKSENGGEFFTAIARLKSEDYDDTKREGVITFKDKASDYTADYTIVCDPSTFGTQVEWDAQFDLIFDPNPTITGAITKAQVKVIAQPGNAVQMMAFEKMGFWYSEEPTTKVTFSEVTAMAAPMAAYTVKRFEMSLEANPYSTDWGSQATRAFRVFPVPVDRVDTFDPNNTNIEYKDVVQYREDLARVDENTYLQFANVGESIDITFQASVACNVTMGDLERDNDWNITGGVIAPDFEGWSVTKKSESALERGMRTYVYTITMPECPQELQWGRSSTVLIIPTTDATQAKQLGLSQGGWW